MKLIFRTCFLTLLILFSVVNMTTIYAQEERKKNVVVDVVDVRTFEPRIKIDRQKVIKSAQDATKNKYPNADYVLLDDYEYIYYTTEGTSYNSDEVYVKILTEKGLRQNKILQIGYSASYSEVEVSAINVIKPNGQVINIDIAKNSKDSISSSQLNENIFDPNSRVLTVNIPNLAVGDILYYVYSRKTFKARVPKTWCNYFVLQSMSPYLNYTIEIDAPQTMPLKKIFVKDEVKNSISYYSKNVGSRIIYSWQAKNVPQIIPEDGMPEYYTVAQRLLVSTISSWQDISKWYWNLCKKPLEDVTVEMKDKVDELINNCNSNNEKIYKIFQFVAKDVRYMGLTIEKEAPGYEPHNVSVTFNNRYGVCRDKAALLVAMLRIAKIEAYPVLFYSGPKKDIEVPNNFFNHAIVGVREPDGKFLLMDPTDETTRDLMPAYLSNMSYLAATPYGETLQISPTIDAKKNLLSISTKGKLELSGIFKAQSVLTFKGINDGLYRGAFSRWKKEEVKDFFEGRLTKIFPKLTLNEVIVEPKNIRDMSHPLTVTLKYDVENFISSENKLAMLKAPWLGQQFGAVNFVLRSTGLQKRKFPLKIFSSCGVEENFTIDAKNIGKTLVIPEQKDINSNFLEWHQNINRKNGNLVGKAQFLIKSMEISPNEYLGLKKVIKQIDFEKRKTLIFGRDELTFTEIAQKYHNEDCVILDLQKEYNLAENNNFVVTKLKRLILNYAGKKSYGELKIEFNPSREKVELISGRVISAEGKVFKVKPTELNFMDSSIGGAAPRYPQNKIMVVSFPKVEVGSVVEYEVKRTLLGHDVVAIMRPFKTNNVILKQNFIVNNNDDGKVNYSNVALLFSQDKKTDQQLKLSSLNLDAIKNESYSAPNWVLPTTLLISKGDWSKYINILQSQIKKKLVGTNQLLNAKILEILKQCQTDTVAEKVQIINTFIAKNIRLAGNSFNNMSLENISQVEKTLIDGYGNNLDIAMLYYAMLNAAKIDCEMILTTSLPNVKEVIEPIINYNQIDFFDKVLVVVKDGENHYYLGEGKSQNIYANIATNEFFNHKFVKLNLNSSKKDDVAKFEILTTKQQDKYESFQEYEYELFVAESGATNYRFKNIIQGAAYNNYKKFIKELTNEEKDRYFQKLIASVSQSAKPLEPLFYDVDNYPAVFKATLAINDYTVKDKDFLYLSLPTEKLKNIFRLNTKKRETPFYYSERNQFTISYSVSFPNNVNIKIKPQAFNWQGPKNIGKIVCSVQQKSNNEILICYDVDLKPALLSATDYQQIVKIQEKLNALSTRFILGKIK
ncbi:DUF3857 domain-containing protein [Lentisphaerota bacterium WC36G]|nr:DUF3857 domain-containing protein [Lentisphaerae bacterium WC36]